MRRWASCSSSASTEPVHGNLTAILTAEEFKTEFAASGFEAGIQAESLHPECVVIDFAMGRNEALMIAANLRKNADYTRHGSDRPPLDDDNAAGFDRSMFNETFRKAVRLRPCWPNGPDPRQPQEAVGGSLSRGRCRRYGLPGACFGPDSGRM